MVLQLVREGRFDAEIAVRLGLSNEEVKRRIAAICTKLGVEDRASLRGDVAAGFPATDERDDWSPVIDATADPLPPEVLVINAPEPVEPRTRGSFAAALAGLLLALGVAAVAAWIALGPEPTSEPQDPSVLSITDDPGTIISSFIPDDASTQMAIYVEPSIGLLITPATLVGKGLRPFITDFDLFADTLAGTSGTPVPGARDPYISAPLPESWELLLVRGSSKGGPIAIERASHGEDRTIVIETLFEAPTNGRILDVIALPSGQSLAAAVCFRCPSLLGEISPDARIEYYRSDDGGETWNVAGSRATTEPFAWQLVAFVPGDIVVRRALQPPELLTSGALACGPDVTGFAVQGADLSLVIQQPGTSTLISCDGETVLETKLPRNVRFDDFHAGPVQHALSWHTAGDEPKHYLGIFGSASGSPVVSILQVPNTTRVRQWIDGRLAIGDVQISAGHSISPALIDFDGQVTLLEEPLRAMPVARAAAFPEDERPPQVLEVLAVLPVIHER